MRRVCGGPGDTWIIWSGKEDLYPCGASYEDVDRSTVCPHVDLGGGDTVGLPRNLAAVDPRWLDEIGATRVSGDALCTCGKPYRDEVHPRPDSERIPTLRVACDGRLVKL